MNSGLNYGEGASPPPKKTVILGVGNELLSDEGFGVHVARKLAELKLPQGVEVIEGGTDGFKLLNIITEADTLIVIDAIKGGAVPGSIYRFRLQDSPKFPDLFKTSVHQISMLEVITLSGLIGKTPETTVIGIEPGAICTGMELSKEICEKVPRVIEIIMEELK
jgi:hydrogenase maturation protease